MDLTWADVGAADAVAEGSPLVAEVEGEAVLIVRCGATLHAVEDRCTHDGQALGEAPVEDCEIICPRHGARFCLRTGAALTPPAYEPLRRYPVREESGRVLIGVPG